jgi:hypothetical protein
MNLEFKLSSLRERTEGGTTWPCHASMTTLRVGKSIKTWWKVGTLGVKSCFKFIHHCRAWDI